MAKSITVRAETVEEALEQALSMLNLTIDEVHVRIDRPAKQSVFGWKKVLAEVTVTQVEEEPVPFTRQPSESRIHKGQLELRFREQTYPIIFPKNGVELRLNGEAIQQRTILLPSDTVECVALTENYSAMFIIRIDNEYMTATAKVTPGKKIVRTLEDTSWQEVLILDVSEVVEKYNDLTTQDFIDELQAMDIKEGLCMEGIDRATKTLEETDVVVARGTPIIPSEDAWLDVPAQHKRAWEDEYGRVDFREHNLIPTVKTGQLIATYIPPVQGKSGVNVFGDSQPVKPPKDVVLRPGKQVNCFQNKLYAKIDGRPLIEWRGKLVKVDVNPEYRHATDVNLECGNIHFEGDVWIGGGVHPSMFVAATGNIAIMKNCTKASIRGTKSVVVKGSIFSSTVTVGIQEKVIAMMVKDLKELLTYLKNIESALVQVFTLRGENSEEVQPFILKQVIQLLLEQKYGDFTQLNKSYIQMVKNHSQRLEKEWLELSDRLYLLFVDPLREERTTIQYLRKLIDKADSLLQVYSEEVRPESILQAAFAMNSILYSNGNIHIQSKGVYNSSVTALQDIFITGVCRGGEIIGGRHIEIDETGSKAGVRTHIHTSDGVIRIGKAYPGTTIQIGNRRYEVLTTVHELVAKLNEEGELIISY